MAESSISEPIEITLNPDLFIDPTFSKSKNKKFVDFFPLKNSILNSSKFEKLSASAKVLLIYLVSLAHQKCMLNLTLTASELPANRGRSAAELFSDLNDFGYLQAPKIKEKEIKTNKIKSLNVSAKEGSKKPKITKEETEQNRQIKEVYIEAYSARYRGVVPSFGAKGHTQISNLRKAVGLEDAIKIVRFYLTHNDAKYLKNTHALGFCLLDVDTLRTQMLLNQQITSTKVRQLEKTLDAQEQNNEIQKRVAQLFHDQPKQLGGSK